MSCHLPLSSPKPRRRPGVCTSQSLEYASLPLPRAPRCTFRSIYWDKRGSHFNRQAVPRALKRLGPQERCKTCAPGDGTIRVNHPDTLQACEISLMLPDALYVLSILAARKCDPDARVSETLLNVILHAKCVRRSDGCRRHRTSCEILQLAAKKMRDGYL